MEKVENDAGPIRIVGDLPARRPKLGFSSYASAIADAIRGGRPAQFTIGLYGPWGSGKSSLLAGLASSLETDTDVLVVEFDAWRYESDARIVVPLLHRVAARVSQSPGFASAARQIGRACLALIRSASFESSFGLSVSGAGFLDSWEESGRAKLDDAFALPFEELARVPAALNGRRIVVLIDDLDRCSPAKVVSLLEAINVIMDVPGFIFVLAMDYDVLVRAVNEKYPHVSGHEYIEKMIQVPFRVPPLEVDSLSFLPDLIPGWQSFALARDDKFVRDLAEIIREALRGNPRQAKRLVNSFLILERILESRSASVSKSFLLRLLGFQLGWPVQYKQFQEAVVFGASDVGEIGSSLQPLDADLQRFLERLSGSMMESDSVALAIHLAGSVEPAPTPEPRDSSEGSRGGAPALRRWLRDKGWQSDAQGILWTHESSVVDAKIEVAFGDTAVNAYLVLPKSTTGPNQPERDLWVSSAPSEASRLRDRLGTASTIEGMNALMAQRKSRWARK